MVSIKYKQTIPASTSFTGSPYTLISVSSDQGSEGLTNFGQHQSFSLSRWQTMAAASTCSSVEQCSVCFKGKTCCLSVICCFSNVSQYHHILTHHMLFRIDFVCIFLFVLNILTYPHSSFGCALSYHKYFGGCNRLFHHTSSGTCEN